jgi:hypothetical protein
MFLLALPFESLTTKDDFQYLNGSATLGGSTDVSIDAVIPAEFASGKSLLISNTSRYVLIPFPFYANQAGKTLNMQFYFSCDADDGLIVGFCQNKQVEDHQCYLYRNTSGYLEVRRGAIILATGATSLLASTFYKIDIELLVANAGGIFKVYLNDSLTPDLSFTGDTQYAGANDLYSICFGSNYYTTPLNLRIFRPIIFNSDGTVNNARVPNNVKLFSGSLTSDGANTWDKSSGADAYSLINETFGSVNDASYVKQNTLNAKNECQMNVLPSDVGAILGLQSFSRYVKPVVGAIGVKNGVKTQDATEKQNSERTLTGVNNHIETFEFKTGSTPFVTADFPLKLSSQITRVN